MIYLQISTAQGPAECRIFARFVLDTDSEPAVIRNSDFHWILRLQLRYEMGLSFRN